LQAHCWKILRTSIKLVDIDTTPKLLYSFWERGHAYRDPKAAKKLYQLMTTNLCQQFRVPAQLSHTKSTLGNGIDQWIQNSQDEFLVHPTMAPMFEVWRSQLDRKMQEAIACEVLDFVSQIRQNGILTALIENAVYNFLLVSAAALKDPNKLTRYFNKMAPNADLCDVNMVEDMIAFTTVLTRMDKTQFEKMFVYIRDDVAQSIVFTDWAGEFQRLENLELARAK